MPNFSQSKTTKISHRKFFRIIPEKKDPYVLTVAKNVLEKLRKATKEFHSYGISFDNRLLQHENEIQEAIERGVVLHITMLSANTNLTPIAPNFGQEVEQLKHEIEISLENVQALSSKYPGKVVVNYVKHPSLYRLFAADLHKKNHSDPNAVIFFYGAASDIHALPAYEFNYAANNPASKHIDDYLCHLDRCKASRKAKVFLIHGRDKKFNEKVRVFLHSYGVDCVVLDELPNEGKTIIEKFEHNTNVHYAIVLLTPDDYGCLKSEYKTKWGNAPNFENRARENVMFEWGYLTGKLTRKNVACIRKGDAHIPSDLEGLVYHEVKDDDENIPISVLKELVSAGFPVDLG